MATTVITTLIPAVITEVVNELDSLNPTDFQRVVE